MKKVCFFVMAAAMTLFAACSGSGNAENKEGENAPAVTYDGEKAGQLVEKYKEDPSTLSEEDAQVVINLYVDYLNDLANFTPTLKGKSGKEFFEAGEAFEKNHPNFEGISRLFIYAEEFGTEENMKAVREAREKLDKAREELYKSENEGDNGSGNGNGNGEDENEEVESEPAEEVAVAKAAPAEEVEVEEATEATAAEE